MPSLLPYLVNYYVFFRSQLKHHSFYLKPPPSSQHLEQSTSWADSWIPHSTLMSGPFYNHPDISERLLAYCLPSRLGYVLGLSRSLQNCQYLAWRLKHSQCWINIFKQYIWLVGSKGSALRTRSLTYENMAGQDSYENWHRIVCAGKLTTGTIHEKQGR